jgi:hypothetical protein
VPTERYPGPYIGDGCIEECPSVCDFEKREAPGCFVAVRYSALYPESVHVIT